LVYADWLQENGRAEQGEFIRTQCRLTTAGPDDPEYPALLDREAELRLWLTAHAPGPRPTFPGGLTVEGGRNWWKWAHRGFPRFVEFDGYGRHGAKAMRALAAGLTRAFDSLPTRWLVVRYVTVAQLVALLKQPVLAGLSHLTVQLDAQGAEADDAVRALAGCRHLRNLRGLSLAVAFGDAGSEALAGAHWAGLEWFAPAAPAVSPAGVRGLAGADWFHRVRALTLSGGLSGAALEALARLAPFPRLHTLDLSDNLFPEPAWQAFAKSRAFPALARLELSDCDLSGGRFASLAGATGFAPSVLRASAGGAGPGAGAALADAPWAPQLRVLNLAYNALGPADVRALAGCKRLTNLQHLDLSYNAIGPAGLTALAGNPALRGLRALLLAGRAGDSIELGPAHLGRLLTKLDLPDLRHLDLSGRPVGATAAKKLCAPKFAALTRLALKGCKLTDAAVAALVGAPAVRNLIQLDLSDNGLKAGPNELGDPAVLPFLAACSLGGNPLTAPLVRRLRARPGVNGLPKAEPARRGRA
ncbi:MAG: TIGR02996 domain-containing protein, partial [Gemmata sp.]